MVYDFFRPNLPALTGQRESSAEKHGRCVFSHIPITECATQIVSGTVCSEILRCKRGLPHPCGKIDGAKSDHKNVQRKLLVAHGAEAHARATARERRMLPSATVRKQRMARARLAAHARDSETRGGYTVVGVGRCRDVGGLLTGRRGQVQTPSWRSTNPRSRMQRPQLRLARYNKSSLRRDLF